MPARRFLDTNILIYAIDRDAPAKRERARHIIEQALVERDAVISFQVVQEWTNIALRKFGLTARQVESFFATFLQPLWSVHPSAAIFERALSIHAETGFAWYDSLIVSSAAAAPATILLSEDLQHGRVVRGVRIENPFV